MKKEVVYNKDINFTEDKVDIQRVEEVVADTSVNKEEEIIEEHGLQNNDLSDIRNENWRIVLDNETPITRLGRNEGDLEGVQQHLIEAQYFDVTIKKDNSSSFIEKRNRVQDSNEDILDFNMQVLHEHDDIQMNDNRTLDGSEEWNDFFNAKEAYISAKLHKKHEVKKMIKDLLGINMLALDEDCDTNPRNSGYSSFAENIENDLKEESVEDKEQVSDKRVGNISLPIQTHTWLDQYRYYNNFFCQSHDIKNSEIERDIPINNFAKYYIDNQNSIPVNFQGYNAMKVSDHGIKEEYASDESVPVQNNVAQVYVIYLLDQLLDNIRIQVKNYQVCVQFLKNYLEKYNSLPYERLGDLLSLVANQALGCEEPNVIVELFVLFDHLNLLNIEIGHAVATAQNSMQLQSYCNELRASLAANLLFSVENIDNKTFSDIIQTKEEVVTQLKNMAYQHILLSKKYMLTVKSIYNKLAGLLNLVLYDEDISSDEVRESKDSSIEKNDYSKESGAFYNDAKQWNTGVFVKSSHNDLVQPHIFDIALDQYGNQEFSYTVEQVKAMVFERYSEDGELHQSQQVDYDTGLIKEAAAKYMQDVAIDISSIEYCQVL